KGTTWSISFDEAVCGRTKAAAVGAQTERPGVAGAGESVAWRQGLTGRFGCPLLALAGNGVQKHHRFLRLSPEGGRRPQRPTRRMATKNPKSTKSRGRTGEVRPGDWTSTIVNTGHPGSVLRCPSADADPSRLSARPGRSRSPRRPVREPARAHGR